MGLANGPELPADLQFTERQELIMRWLRENRAPELAELYRGAVMMLNNARFPGRVRFVAHAVREIRNALPNLVGAPRVPQPLEYKKEVDEISEAWEDNVLLAPLTEGHGGVSGQIAEDAVVTVRWPLFAKVDGLVRKHRKASEKPREAAGRLIRALAPETPLSERDMERAVDHWLRITNWFMQCVHVHAGRGRVVGDSTLMATFEQFEAALWTLLAPFFKVVEEIDEILGEADN